MIGESGKPSLHVNEFKKAGFSPKITDKLPKDPKGHVTAEGIDKHIESLPKTKINVDVLPYLRGEQMHRKNPEFVMSMHMHPDEKAKMDKREKAAWDHMKNPSARLVQRPHLS